MATSSLKKSFVISSSSSFCAVQKPCYNNKTNLSTGVFMAAHDMEFTHLLKSIFDYDPDGPNIHHLMAVHGYSRLIAQNNL